MSISVRRILSALLLLSGMAMLVYVLQGRYHLGLVRYFDMDEYAYLYWARHMVDGLIPYRDFFYYSPPGFLFLLAPVVALWGISAQVLTGGRIFAFAVYLLLLLVCAVGFFRQKRRWTCIIVPLVLAVLPMPSDKFLEVRPDTLMLVFLLAGIVLQLEIMQRSAHSVRRGIVFLSGLSYALSVLVLPKAVPQVLFGGIVFCVWAWNTGKLRHILPAFLTGGIVPVIAFGIWVLWQGVGSDAWYFLTRAPMEVNKLAALFPIPPQRYFEPNDVYYGTYGYHAGWWWNAVVWVTSITVAAFGLAASVPLLFGRRNPDAYTAIFMRASLLLQVGLYVWFFPMKHSQYLMPAAVFAAWVFAEWIDAIYVRSLSIAWKHGAFLAVWAFFLYSACTAYQTTTLPKFNFGNAGSYRMLSLLLSKVSRDTYIYDLEGLTMFYRQPYPVPVLPVGQFTQFLTEKPPLLRDTLSRKHVVFIYQGESRRTNTLTPEDLQYVNEQYVPVGDGSLLVSRDQAAVYWDTFR